jgi:hypothetical protein
MTEDSKENKGKARHRPATGSKRDIIYSLSGSSEFSARWRSHRQDQLTKPAKKAATKAAGTRPKQGWQKDRINEVLREVYPPHGRIPADISHKQVQRDVGKAFKKRGWGVPGVDTIGGEPEGTQTRMRVCVLA